jgi:hypothetical protein
LTWSTSPSPSSTTPSYISGPPNSNQQSTFERPPSSHGYNTTYATLPAGGSSSNGGSASAALPAVASPSADVIPPSRRRVTPNSARDREPGAGRGHGPGSAGSSRGNSTPASGVSKQTGILKCSSCKTTQSPEWRKGPSGKKELCNALVSPVFLILKIDFLICADVVYVLPVRGPRRRGPLLRRLVAGRINPTWSKRESATPPSYAPYPTTARKGSPRRGLDRGSSSHSSGEVYSTHLHHHPRRTCIRCQT